MKFDIKLALILLSLCYTLGCIEQLGLGTTTTTTTIPTPQMVSALAKPGVVLIENYFEGVVVLPEAGINEFTGEIYPLTTTYTREVSAGFLGSGFIVSPDGYIITNAHVVVDDPQVLEYQLLSAALAEEVNEIGRQPTPEQYTFLQNYVFGYGKVTNIKQTFSSYVGVPVPGVTTVLKEFKGDVRKKGEPYPGRDIAILKVDQKNMPTVKLGDSDGMQVGDTIYAIGYPGVATFHEALSLETITEPTITSGIVSAEKKMGGGFRVLQVSAASTHGNSGGPVINDRGEVIGILTFGSLDYSRPEWPEIQGFNFAMPINLAKEYLSEINVKNTRGPVDEHYEKGLGHYWKGDYAKAIEEFTIVRNLFPAHPYVQHYISDSQEKLLKTD